MNRDLDALGIIIQARLGSNRFPRKVLMPFYGGDTVLEYLIKRIRRAIDGIPIIVATSVEKIDDEIPDLLKGCNDVSVFRGDECNVLDRFIKCATEYGFKKVIRVCADNPFLDVKGLAGLISYMQEKNVDYAGYYIEETPAIKTHYGLWAEGVSLSALEKVAKKTNEKVYLEHVTNYIYENEKVFDIGKIGSRIELPISCPIRFTMDTERDYTNLRRVCELLQGEDECIESLLRVVQADGALLENMRKEIVLNKK